MLSVIVITKNESEHISRCLESVAWADEIIVLDSGSSDNTVAISKQYTDKVFETDWPGYGPQKQRALNKANGDWVLSLDADETISPELKHEIQEVMKQSRIKGYEIPRRSSFCGKQIKHSGWWPDFVLRLFQREFGRFTDDLVHEHIVINNEIGRLNNPILHESYINLDEVLHKINSYSSLGAKKLFDKGKKTSLLHAIGKGLWTFFRTYILKAGFLDGSHGLMLAISNAEGTYYKYLKLLELQKTNK